MAQLIVDALQKKFGSAITETSAGCGNETVVVDRSKIREMCAWLKSDPALHMNMVMDICGVDFPDRAERFEVVYHLYSTVHKHRVRLKVRVTEADAVVDSVISVWRGANWFERETYDMYGISFTDHPNLKRLLTFKEFEGHPLRKDYPVTKRPPIPTPDDMLP